MLALLLYHLAQGPETIIERLFIDVDDGQYYADAISWAATNDIVSGYGNGIFGSDDPITREQLATLLWRHAGTSPISKGTLDDYTDSGKISSWAVGALRRAAEQGIVTGKAGGGLVLCPACSLYQPPVPAG